MANKEPVIIQKNRKRAFWSLVIVIFFVPVSGSLVLLGLQPGRPEVSWALVLFGVLGLVAFSGSAILIIRTMRSPWHLRVEPDHLAFYTPTYDLQVPWDRIAGIAVSEVNRRPGCVLVFEDVEAVAQSATFHSNSRRPDAVTNSTIMRVRMEENLELCGYHFAIPSRVLEMGPDELAELLTKALKGELWQNQAHET